MNEVLKKMDFYNILSNKKISMIKIQVIKCIISSLVQVYETYLLHIFMGLEKWNLNRS